MSKENRSRYAILGMLSLAPMSGYDLKRTIAISVSNFWHESYGQIYPMLKQLAAEGLVTSSLAPQAGRRTRRIYQLTEQGWEKLGQWLAAPYEHQVERNELLLKLFFGQRAPASVSLAHVQRFRAFHAEHLRRYEQSELFLRQEHAGRPDLAYWLATVSFGKHIAHALIAWCDETLAALSAAEAGASAPAPQQEVL